MKRYLPFVIVVVVALATFGSGAILYRAKLPQLKNIPESQRLLAKGGAESVHVRGNPDAPVTLEEFGDFQCPPCGQFAAFVEELRKEYDSRLRVVLRNIPLTAHEHAREAALAAEAAGFQGKFWEMYDTLYREQAVWSKAPNARELFESYAGTIGVNLDQFKKDVDSDKARQRVDSDQALADSLGIKVTPSVFINNRPVDPKDKNPEGIRAEINAVLQEKSKSGA
jgi:protein-disulfide isomerase